MTREEMIDAAVRTAGEELGWMALVRGDPAIWGVVGQAFARLDARDRMAVKYDAILQRYGPTASEIPTRCALSRSC